MTDAPSRDPLHGLTLEALLTTLVNDLGCFAHEPSIRSSLKFLRKTPWARAKVESLYLWHLREQRRQARRRT
jgi:uncharacterized protein (DUF2132 family)